MSRIRAHEILLEIFEQREYKIINQDEEHILSLKPDGTHVITLFNDIPKFNVVSMIKTISLMNELKVFHAIVIYKEGITPHVSKTAQQLKKMRIDFISEKDIQYNITKHRLQPKFYRLEKKEAEKFKTTFGVKFGTMRITDPISLFYDYKRGDVIRVTRKGGYVTYRIVK